MNVPPNVSVWTIRGWSDLLAIASIVVLLLSGVAWGLKLENRIDVLILKIDSQHNEFAAQIAALKEQLNRGILPVTEAKIEGLEARIVELRAEMSQLRGDITYIREHYPSPGKGPR